MFQFWQFGENLIFSELGFSPTLRRWFGDIVIIRGPLREFGALLFGTRGPFKRDTLGYPKFRGTLGLGPYNFGV